MLPEENKIFYKFTVKIPSTLEIPNAQTYWAVGFSADLLGNNVQIRQAKWEELNNKSEKKEIQHVFILFETNLKFTNLGKR